MEQSVVLFSIFLNEDNSMTYAEIYNRYRLAQAKYNAKKETYDKRKTDYSLKKMNEEKKSLDPVRDSAIIFAVNNPSKDEGLALLQYMDSKGADPTQPLSDGRLLIDLVVAKQAESAPEGQDPIAWSKDLETMRTYAEQLPKLKESLERLKVSNEAMKSSMSRLTVWTKLEEQAVTTDAAHNAAIVKAGHDHLEAKLEVTSSSQMTSK